MTDDITVVGALHVHGCSEWLITSHSVEIAMSLGVAFGGAAPRRGPDCLWEIVCSAAPLSVLVGCIEEHALVLRPAELEDPGWLRLDFDPWTAVDVLGAEVVASLEGAGKSSSAVLDLRTFYFTTRGGMIVRYPAAALAVA
jgi:hypothetical protein